MNNWQPIETAPKATTWTDGHHEHAESIIAYLPRADVVTVVHWWQYRNKDGMIDGSNFLTEGGSACWPSHWIPLPEPPSEDKTK